VRSRFFCVSSVSIGGEKIISLQHDRFSLGHDKHLIFDAVDASRFAQTLERFFQRLVPQAKTAVMHRHECLCFELVESAHRFFRIHVHFARKWRIVSADGQKRDLDVVAFTDFFESFEISSVAAMKYGTPIRADYETAKAAMSIRKKASAPMMRGSERNFERTELDGLPFIQFVHNVEPEPMDQTSDANRNDNWLIGRDELQCAAIEMIEMRVGYEHEIDRRQMMDMKSGFL